MTEPISPELLRRFYAAGWERRWLAWLNDHGVPGDTGYRLRLERTLALMRVPPTRPFRVLDAGCGVGIYAVQAARRFPGSRVLWIDLSPAHVAAATELAVRWNVSGRVTFQVMDLTNPNLASSLEGGWDVILLAETLEHLLQPAPVLSHLQCLAAPGGQILVSVPQQTPDERGESWVYHRVLTGRPNLESVEARDPATLPAGEVYTYYHRHYRPAEMEALFTQVGLAIRGRHTVFWQRPAHLTAWPWKVLDDLIGRTAWSWLDRTAQALGGSAWAQTLLWECQVLGGQR